MIKSADRDYHIILYAFFTIVLIVFYPWTQGIRYLYPLLPFYIHFVFIGFQWFFKTLGGSWSRAAQGLTACLLILVALYFARFSTHKAFSNIENHRKVEFGPYDKTSQDMFSFIRENVPDDAVIVFWKPRAMRMLTNRKSIMVDSLPELNRGSHLCIYSKTFSFQIPYDIEEKLVQDGMLKMVYANSDFRFYQIEDSVN